MRSVLKKITFNVYCVTISIIVFICIFCTKMRFANSNLCENFLSPLILLLFGMVFLCGISYILNFFEMKRAKKIMIIFTIGLFCIQAYCVYNYYFFTDWDVNELISFSDLLSHNQDISDYAWYFSRYPNNLFLAFVFSGIRILAHNIGLHAHEYFAILLVQCLLNSLTGYLLFCIVDQLFEEKHVSFLGYAIYICLIGISPWVSIPYSDSMALIFPSLIIYIYICNNKINSTIKWFIIGTCSAIGYKIKPQVFIVFIAIILIETIDFAKIHELKESIINDTVAVIGVIVGLYIVKLGISTIHISIDRNMSFGIAHFFMMGMNPVDMGVWSGTDVDFSASFATYAERNAANLYQAFERIKSMQLPGLIEQFIGKTLTNYYNGTFSWGGEGIFFSEVFNVKPTLGSVFLRSLYYTGEYAYIGKYYILWSNFEQMIWLTIIFLNIFSWSAPKKKNICVIMLSILGLTLFELLFEARARYLFTYAPLYIILALYGFQYIISRLELMKKSSDKSTCL